MWTRDARSYRGWLMVAAGHVAILAGGFLPWVRSGRAWRNSYELVRTADRLGLVGDGIQRVLAVGWYLVPLLCGLTLAAIALERPWLSHLGTVAVASMVAVTAVVALRAPLTTGSGPRVAGAGAALAVAGTVLAAVDRRGATQKSRLLVTRNPRPWRPSRR
ncbi:MAG: hypothetical protein WKF43_15675 [Acidimicrobiales bacterium]